MSSRSVYHHPNRPDAGFRQEPLPDHATQAPIAKGQAADYTCGLIKDPAPC